MDALLHNNLGKAKIKTLKGKTKILQCRCYCQCFQMVLGNYIKLFRYTNSGAENRVSALFFEYPYQVFKQYLHLIPVKLENRTRKWRTAWRLQIFLMATHFSLFTVFAMLTFCTCCTKNVTCCTKNRFVSTKKEIFHIEVMLLNKIMCHKNIFCGNKKS